MNITIIGTGLIGASMGLALRKLGHEVCGHDQNTEHLNMALQLGGINKSEENLDVAIQKADIVALCVPVDAVVGLLPQLLTSIPSRTVVMDMGSTKLDICRSVASHPRRQNFVAVHPMAGVEHSGPLAAHVDLYINAKVIICEAQKSSSFALNTVLGLLQEMKMKTLFMDADEHDRQLALVSHLPQFIAYALASLSDFDKSANNQWIQLGGGGLQSSIRLGKSDAAMWMPIFKQNKLNLLQYVDKYISQLQCMRDLITNDDMQNLSDNIRMANENYEHLNYKKKTKTSETKIESTPKFFYS